MNSFDGDTKLENIRYKVENSIKFSKKYLDFGRGFYITTYKEQAEKWANSVP